MHVPEAIDACFSEVLCMFPVHLMRMFLRRLMYVPYTFDAFVTLIFLIMFLRHLMFVPQTFDACSSGV